MSEFPRDKRNQLNSQASSLGPVGALIDNSLDEVLGAATPIPVGIAYQRIQARYESSESTANRDHSADNRLFTDAQLDLATERSRQEILRGGRNSTKRYQPIGPKLLAIATLAASLGAVALIAWWSVESKLDRQAVESSSLERMQSNTESGGSVAVEKNNGPQTVPSGSAASVAGAEHSNEDHSVKEPSNNPSEKLRGAGEVHSLAQQRPANLSGESSESSTVASDSTPAQARKPGFDEVSDREVVAVIDSQFQQIWKQVDLLDGKVRDLPLSVDRIARLLLHRAPTSSELEAIRRDKSAGNLTAEDRMVLDVIDRWISSDEFYRVWAEQLADFYTGGTSKPGVAQDRFARWLEDQIREDIPVMEIQRNVLYGVVDPEHPAHFLQAHWSGLVPAARTPSGDWVGLDSSQSRGLVGMSQLFVNVTGNSAIGCTQCHARQSQDYPVWLTGYSPKVSDAAGAKPVVLDSIAALMLQAILPGQSELFVKEQDDRVSKIAARLPDGRRVGSDVPYARAVDTWVEQGSHLQSSLIQALWKDFFGETILSDFGIDAGVAIQERRDLVEYLAKQSVDKKAGVRQIVYWMLRSIPASQPEESMDYMQFMALDSDALGDLAVRRGVFKSLVLDATQNGQTQSESIGSFASKVFPERADWLERSFLAQPSNQQVRGTGSTEARAPVSRGSNDGQSQWSPSLLRAELRFRFASEESKRWAKLLSESKLEDEQLVEHAYLISRHRWPTQEEQKAWSDREWSSSQRVSAVLRLLSGVESFEP